MPSRFCIHYIRKSGRPSSGHRTGKGQFFIPFPKKGSTKECANHQTISLISHASKVMLKILHARLQHYMNQELPSWVNKWQRNQRSNANICWIIEKAREFQKNIYLYFIDYTKVFDCVDHDQLWKALTCFLKNLCAGQEETVRSLYGTADWFKI